MSPKLFLLLVALVCYFLIPVESGRLVSKRSTLDSAFKAKRFVIRLRRDAAPEETAPVAPAEVTPIVEPVDWASWLEGVVADVAGVATTFNNHRLDFDTLGKLDVASLQSIGISSEDAAKIVSKNELEDWLVGVVSNDDISFVIKACLENRITLASLTKLSLADIASTGIALGDATRIFAKANPQVDTATTLPAAVDALPNTTAPITINIVLTGADNTTTVASIQIGSNVTAGNTTTTTETAVVEDEDDEETETIVIVEPVITTAERKRSVQKIGKKAWGDKKAHEKKAHEKKALEKKEKKSWGDRKTRKNKSAKKGTR